MRACKVAMGGHFFWTMRYVHKLLSSSSSKSLKQSHYREVPRWDIFMEQELRFWLDFGQMADFPEFLASKSFDI